MFFLCSITNILSNILSESERGSKDLKRTSFLEPSASHTLEWNVCSWKKRSLEGQGQLFWKESVFLGWGPVFWPSRTLQMGTQSVSGPQGRRRCHIPWGPQAVGKCCDGTWRSAGALWASVAFMEGYPVSSLIALALVGPKLCNCFQHWKVGLEWWSLQSFLIICSICKILLNLDPYYMHAYKLYTYPVSLIWFEECKACVRHRKF